ncbi:MAG: SIMPL domain-containing protein [Vicinamibacterales bacterium]
MTRVLSIALTLALVASPAFAQTAPPSAPSIVTQGQAVLKRAPDRAWLTVATETRDAKAADARKTNADLMNAVQAALKRAGAASDAIRTTGYSLTPEMEWNNGRAIPRGYLVRNQIEVRVDDLDRLGDLIDAANAPKGTGLSIIGPRFGLKDESAAESEALKQAVQAALSRAEAMAAGARRTLGAIVRIEEQNVMRPGPEPMAFRMATAKAPDAADTPITPGEIEIRAQVTLTVEIR